MAARCGKSNPKPGTPEPPSKLNEFASEANAVVIRPLGGF